MKFRIFFWVSIICWWCIIGDCNGIINEDFEKDIISNNVDDVVDSSNVAKPRQKRFFELWCMNFPDCCDIRGKDRCGFACPVCPIKTDMCKLDILFSSNHNIHKSWYGLCLLASDPLIDRFYLRLRILLKCFN